MLGPLEEGCTVERDGQLTVELIADAQKWSKTFAEASDEFSESLIYRAMQPYIDFVVGLDHYKMSFMDRLYVLIHGKLPTFTRKRYVQGTLPMDEL